MVCHQILLESSSIVMLARSSVWPEGVPVQVLIQHVVSFKSTIWKEEL